MAEEAHWVRETSEGVVLELYIQPRASKNECVGIHQGSLKIRLTAPPVEGEANKECVRFVAKLFGVPRSSVAIVQGHASRHKSVLIHGLSLRDVERSLEGKGIS